jgi:hypothetical protein
MRRLPYSGIAVLAVLLASPIWLEAPAQACDENYPSCMLPKLQEVQEQPSADEAPVAEEADAPVVRTAAPRPQQKSHRSAERRPTRPAATTARRTEAVRHDPDPPATATLPPLQTDRRVNRSEPAVPQMPVQASADPWAAFPAVATDTSAAPPSQIVDSGAADQTPIAQANDVNVIGLAAADAPAPADISWLHGLLAVFGGALIAGSAARLLLV